MSEVKKPDAWMPVYIGDWDADTGHLTCEEDGAYWRLVRHYWRRGPLPDDDARLANITGLTVARWRKVRGAIEDFFRVGGGVWRHKRIDSELKGAVERKEKAVDRARRAAEKRWSKDDPPPPKGNARSNATSIRRALLEECPSPSPSQGRELDPQKGSSSPSHGADADARADSASSLPRRPDGALDFEEIRKRIDAEQAAESAGEKAKKA